MVMVTSASGEVMIVMFSLLPALTVEGFREMSGASGGGTLVAVAVAAGVAVELAAVVPVAVGVAVGVAVELATVVPVAVGDETNVEVGVAVDVLVAVAVGGGVDWLLGVKVAVGSGGFASNF